MKTLEVLFTPADFAELKHRNLDQTLCVVFDVFRATSSMITALSNGAVAVIPVGEIPEALEIRRTNPAVLLAGERDGLRIGAALTGGVEFDLGNSPREFTKERVAGKTIVSTTTNGTRALRSCAHAKTVLIGSFLNLAATARAVQQSAPESLIIICSGTFKQTALEDALGAGALCDMLWDRLSRTSISDAALMAHKLYQLGKADVLKAASESRNGRKLLANPDLHDDVPFCMQVDKCNFAAALQKDGHITVLE
ncbi:MAG TPA: 2-phosphosulfolactate phosphatase [Candidatus Paceibacterota bacterium]|nr:2-phosphosulfolactate phosphatase [Candidatus Paceibacterota bacterium]